MEISLKTVAGFREIYAKEFGEPIGEDEARQMALRVLTLYERLLAPLPKEER